MHINPATGLMEPDEGDDLAPPATAAPVPTVAPYQPAPMAAPAAPAPLGLPPRNIQMTRHELTPAGRDTLAAMGANTAAQVATAQQEGEIGVQRARALEEQQNREAAVKSEYDQRRLAALDQGEKDLAAARAHHQQLYDEFRQNNTLKDYWQDKSTGQKILAGIAVFLGGLGQRNGGSNGALQIIQSSIDADMARQRAAIEGRRQAVVDAKGDIAEAQQGKLDALRTLDVKEAAARSTVAEEIKKRLTALGVPQAQIDANQGVQAIEAGALKTRQAIDEKDRTTVIAGVGKRLTGGGGGGGGKISELVQMKIDGADDAAIARRAEALHIPPKVYLPSLREVRADAGAAARAADAAARGAAKTQAAADKNDATIVRDDQGNPIGRVPTGRGGAQGFATRDADYMRAQHQLEALAADVAANGERVFSPEAVKRRQTLKHNADIAVATVSPLGKTNEAMKAESESIGASGAYTAMGANPAAIAKKIEELNQQRARYRAQTLIPISGGGGVSAGGGGAMGARSATPPPPSADEDKRAVAKALLRIKKDPEDQIAREILHANGYPEY